jgi:hypothetical protein
MPVQPIYARWVDFGTRIGFLALVATFVVYVFGLVDPLVRPQDLARLWGLPVDRYVAEVRGPTGWGWLALLGKADYLNYLGVTFLASVSIAAYARIVPTLIALGDRTYAALAILQVVILVAAALY